ncbi:hypothetical protein GGH12_002766 [Coemansia sp. RSA 1822]|nr:hypothetical protein LPJ76_002199 [Coemansia sp. RSA 638]KAJ2538214.1 hypothetical protein GGF49_006048 [Coemansia sp. RSA 1853]KAJ2563164.1 hypothetical protein GGH12_002766 [Coemansia sp. RSA 1822]
MEQVKVLILGHGFVGEYLAELLAKNCVSYAATTRNGRNATIKWQFSSTDTADFSALPAASFVVVMFPVNGSTDVDHLCRGYTTYHQALHPNYKQPRWIFLGSTRAFTQIPSTKFTPPDTNGGPRMDAETHAIDKYNACVLNLVGLWGGARCPRGWARFYTKDRLRSRLNDRSLHLVHGADVARAILEVVRDGTINGRWLVSDQRVYDMLQIVVCDGRVRGLLSELLEDKDVQAILRATRVEDVELGPKYVTRRIDSSHFWDRAGIQPHYIYALDQPDPHAI